MSLSKSEIIQALQDDDFALKLTEEDDGKTLPVLFKEHAIKIIEALEIKPTINDIKKNIEENSPSEYDDDSNTSPNQTN